tara:strand:- start:2744 stop:7090 length:4347 start_codon:yes stop_codon:yes gene_type:complete
MAEEKKIFAGGGMDMDTEERFIQSNDYRYALNCRITSSDEENQGTVENVRGNKLVGGSSITTPSGATLDDARFVVIGSFEDKKFSILYYFVCDTSGNDEHCIVSNFFPDTNNVASPKGFRILYFNNNNLNFNVNYLITGVNIIHSNEFAPAGILYWTDDLNPPRKINPLRAYWFITNPGITDPKFIYLEDPPLHAVPNAPTSPPLVCSGTWGDKKSNYIKGNLWQFKYRYIYRDAQKSSWSPISESITTRNVYSNTVLLEEDNYVQVKIKNGRKDVSAIDIAARKNGTGDDFYLVCTIKKDNSLQENISLSSFGNPGNINTPTVKTTILDSMPNWQNIYFLFTGNEPKIPIDLQASNKLYDDVPLLAKSQEIVDGNRLVYGNIVNGYDPVVTDTELSVVYQETQETIGNFEPIGYTVHAGIDSYNWAAGVNGRAHARFTIRIQIPDMSTRLPGEVIHLKLEGIHFHGQIERFDGICGHQDGERLMRVDFDSTFYICQGGGLDTMTTIRQHMENNCITTFTNMYGYNSSNDDKWLFGWGHGQDGNGNGDNPISTGTYQGGTVGAGLWGASGNDLSLDFAMWLDDYMNVGTCNAFKARVVIGLSGVYARDHNFPNPLPTPWPGSTPDFPVAGNQVDGDGDHNLGNIGWSWPPAYLDVQPLTSAEYNALGNTIQNNMILIGLPIDLGKGNERGFKSGTRHNFGLVYYDYANRSGALNKAGSVYVPSRNERDSAITDFTAHIHFKIKHPPPYWATHYQWLHSSEKIEDFVQVLVKEIFWDSTIKARYNTVLPDSVTDNTGLVPPGYQAVIEAAGGFSNGAVIMDMEELIKHSAQSSANNFLWDWKKGDRVKIIDTVNFTGQDWEIIGVIEDINGIYGNSPIGGQAKLWFVLEQSVVGTVQSAQASGVAENVFVEIYRPAPTGEDIYYEFNHTNRISLNGNNDLIHEANSWACGHNEGQLSGVTNQAGVNIVYVDELGNNTPAVFSYNQGDTANPDASLPAEGTFLKGDIYIRDKYAAIAPPVTLITEHYTASDFWPSKAWDEGRPNAYLPDFKQTRRDSTIFFSEPFVPNTAINGFGTFFPDVSFQEYDKSYNSIQKLFSINDKLIILQEDKVSRALVSRAVLFDATSKQNVAISQNVLSISDPYTGDFGISRNPESFVNFGFRSYFVDIKRRVVLRLSQDGLTPISEHNMKNFFTDYFQEVIDNNKHIRHDFRAYGAYDNKFDEYVISIADINWQDVDMSTGNTTNRRIHGFTVGFHELSKRWNSFYSYKNFITTYNTELYSFLNASVYQHNAAIVPNTVQIVGRPDPALYNNFYGVDYESHIEFALNQLPDITKVFHSISEHSNNIWELDSLYTRNGQVTNIFLNEFTGGTTYNWEKGHGTKENIHNATIRCDVLSPGIANAKIEGNRMRDTSAMCRLALPIPQAQEQTVLFSIKFGFIPSSNPSLIQNQ